MDRQVVKSVEVTFYWYGYEGSDKNRYTVKDENGSVRDIDFDEAYKLATSQLGVYTIESTFYKSVYKSYLPA